MVQVNFGVQLPSLSMVKSPEKLKEILAGTHMMVRSILQITSTIYIEKNLTLFNFMKTYCSNVS